jgi:hypothetical protein
MPRTEGSGSADDHSLALDLLGEIDLVAGRVLDEDVQVGNGVALLDEVPGGAVEGGGPDAGDVGCDTASEHDGSIGDYGVGIEDWSWAGAGGKARVPRSRVIDVSRAGGPSEIWGFRHQLLGVGGNC